MAWNFCGFSAITTLINHYKDFFRERRLRNKKDLSVLSLPRGSRFTVLKIEGEKRGGKDVGKRLSDMGFTEGALGEVIRSGKYQNPLQLKIRGYDILVRRSEARYIIVSTNPDEGMPS